MKVITDIGALPAALDQLARSASSLALVPTMGNIHRGHLKLVELALEQARSVAVSLFVNPTQFDDSDDYRRYPRTLDEDLEQLRCAGAHLVFAPDGDAMYPHSAQQPEVTVAPTRLGTLLEGAHRPGHFLGVATVVAKLLNLFKPGIAVFGRKDYQQLRVVQALVRELFIPTRILDAPIVRESDGLALSSRNRFLSARDRDVAPGLYRALRRVAEELRGGNQAFAELEAAACDALRESGFGVDYVTVRRPDLDPPNGGEACLVVLGAASLGGTRLIDNVVTDDEMGGEAGLTPVFVRG